MGFYLFEIASIGRSTETESRNYQGWGRAWEGLCNYYLVATSVRHDEKILEMDGEAKQHRCT